MRFAAAQLDDYRGVPVICPPVDNAVIPVKSEDRSCGSFSKIKERYGLQHVFLQTVAEFEGKERRSIEWKSLHCFGELHNYPLATHALAFPLQLFSFSHNSLLADFA